MCGFESTSGFGSTYVILCSSSSGSSSSSSSDARAVWGGAGDEACVSLHSDYNRDIRSPMSLRASAATFHLTLMTHTVEWRNLRCFNEDCLLYGCLYRTTCVQWVAELSTSPTTSGELAVTNALSVLHVVRYDCHMTEMIRFATRNRALVISVPCGVYCDCSRITRVGQLVHITVCHTKRL